MIELQNIFKSYGKKDVLKGVNLKLNRGEIAGLVGENGSGKSTLLSIMSGLERADSGSILYNGKLMSSKEDLSRYAAFVPQDNPLIEELSVKDNLRLWYAESPIKLEEALENGLLKELELDSFLHDRVSTLSGGMKKRLSIACALAYNSPILLLDEPSASLDLLTKRDVQEYTKEYAKNGGTVVLSSHEPDELIICNRLFYLVDGVLVEAPRGTNINEVISHLEKKRRNESNGR
ncbi:ABC transporter ATP-binding protein [Guggenheimella bovis]